MIVVTIYYHRLRGQLAKRKEEENRTQIAILIVAYCKMENVGRKKVNF